MNIKHYCKHVVCSALHGLTLMHGWMDDVHSAINTRAGAASGKSRSLFLMTAFCLLAVSLNALTYVKLTVTGSGSGVNWDNAVGASSLEAIVESGGTVYVAEGTYNFVNEFQLDGKDVELIGGYPITSTGTDLSGYAPVAHPTIFNHAGLGIDRMFDHAVGSSDITLILCRTLTGVAGKSTEWVQKIP